MSCVGLNLKRGTPMRQETLAQEGFEKHRKKTRREQFLEEMDQIVPWHELAAVIEPFYPQPAGAGQRPIGVERMLRIHFLQHWFNLSDLAAEESLYDSRAMRRFVGIDLGREPVPDETTICKFRHLLEAHNLGEQLFVLIHEYLQDHGLEISRGTIVDATIINAPSSTKNKDRQRDPEMRQTKKGNQWYFGMKAHIGVDRKWKLIHSAVATAANVHDSQVLGDLLHCNESGVWGDSAYSGQSETIRHHAPQARDYTQRKAHRHRPLSDEERARNRNKSRVRARGEHPLLVLKRIFGFTKVRYRGLHKNANRLFVACGLVNLFMVRRRLLLAT
jgi:transposase, IS5 family